MPNKAALRKTAEGWQFISESALEDFFWDNLETLLGFTPLERQLSVRGEICDLLALAGNQLVILEFKNSEDRYVIQQLTRYYDNLIEVKPASDRVDYDLPVRLIAIAPSFHRHNLIDRKYSKLEIELITFSISNSQQQFYLNLEDGVTGSLIQKTAIEYQELTLQNQENPDLPAPPKKLLDWLGVLNAEEVENILKIRNKILQFDRRLEEIVESNGILYGSRYGKNRIRHCAEFCFDARAKKILLFLWLAIPQRKTKTVVRMQIHTAHHYETYVRFLIVKQGKLSCNVLQKNVNIKGHTTYTFQDNILSFDPYSFTRELFAHPLEPLVDEALQFWLSRV